MRPQKSLSRQWTLYATLRDRPAGCTVDELAAACSVVGKTIRRDVELLQRVGFPIEKKCIAPNKPHLYWLAGPTTLGPLPLTMDEALVLAIATRLLAGDPDHPFAALADRAFEKTRSLFHPNVRPMVEQLAAAFTLAPRTSPRRPPNLKTVDDLLFAIEHQRFVHLTYQSLHSTEPTTRAICPHGLIQHRNGSLYVIAWAPEHREFRRYKLDRVSEIEVDKLQFERQRGFDLQHHAGGGFGVFHRPGRSTRVSILFDAVVARYLQEHRFHPSQELIPQPDGRLLVVFTLTATEELKTWLFSFGRHAEVVEPLEFRQEVAEELRAAAGRYGANPVREQTPPVRPRGKKQ